MILFLQSNSAAQRRNLSLHECDSMGLLKSAGINVPAFRVATSKTEAVTAAADLGEIRCSSDNISQKCRSKKLIRAMTYLTWRGFSHEVKLSRTCILDYFEFEILVSTVRKIFRFMKIKSESAFSVGL